MTVNELLDKQYEHTSILISEEYNNTETIHCGRIHFYLNDEQHRDMVYYKYKNREVKYFSFFLYYNNNIIMMIQLEKEM